MMPTGYKWGKHSEETKRKMSLAHLGRRFSEEHKRKISISNKGKLKSIEHRKNMSKSKIRKSRIFSDLHKKHLSEKRKYLMKKGLIIPYYKNNEMSKETKQKLSISIKNKWKEVDYFRKNISPKNIKKRIEGLLKRPTSFEQKISSLCFKYNLPFLYKGNGDFLINFKNPDFVNKKDKIVIEVFYSYFKIRDYGSVENYKDFCRKKYNPAGWEVIFIDELDLNCKNWEKICLDKINIRNKFLGKELAYVENNPSVQIEQGFSMKQEAITSTGVRL